jgi:bacterioferritin
MTRVAKSGARKLSDVTTLRLRARQHVESGAVTPSYAADRRTVLRLLDEALATELVCALRYRRHYYMAAGPLAESARKEFLEHADEEMAHAYRIAQRIVQLDGQPNFDPAGLAERSHAEYVACHTLEQMMRENLVAERVSIESYKEIIAYLGDDDPTTRRLLESVLAQEEEHAEELSSMIRKVKPAVAADSMARVARTGAPHVSGKIGRDDRI